MIDSVLWKFYLVTGFTVSTSKMNFLKLCWLGIWYLSFQAFEMFVVSVCWTKCQDVGQNVKIWLSTWTLLAVIINSRQLPKMRSTYSKLKFCSVKVWIASYVSTLRREFRAVTSRKTAYGNDCARNQNLLNLWTCICSQS